jgi:hypothetical protein
MEYRRTVLQDVRLLVCLAQDLERHGQATLSLGQLMREVGLTPSGVSARVLRRTLMLLGTLSEKLGHQPLPTPKLCRRLLLQEAWLQHEAFFDGIDEYLHTTDCDLLKPGCVVGDHVSSRLSCNAATARCQLVALLPAHQDELRAVEAAWTSAPPEPVDTEALTALRRVLENPRAALGERTCWRLGDLIIALEVPEDAAIYTTDGHFGILCKALGKELFVDAAS